MKPFLMYKDRSFAPERMPAAWNEAALVDDLALDGLLEAITAGDKFLLDVCRCALLRSSIFDVDAIVYRHAAFGDCLKNRQVVKQMYDLAISTIDKEHQDYWGLFARHPSLILSRSRSVMEMFSAAFRGLRQFADAEAINFSSPAFTAFFAMVRRELDDQYLATIQDQIDRLRFSHGVTLSAKLAAGNHASQFILRPPARTGPSWFGRLFAKEPRTYSFYIHPLDEGGSRILSNLRDVGVNQIANALAQSVDHILGFFKTLRAELGFYLACLNLHDTLSQSDMPVCLPIPRPAGNRELTCKGLYDVSLALRIGRKAVGNNLDASGKDLVVITGANQGGKTTLLRSLGQSQLMMQAGMVVAAQAFSANICRSLATHFKREEDPSMTSGKLDEELARMKMIVDHTRPDGLVLFNESFSATNEREGSQIAREITGALLGERVKIICVTHLYEFANALRERDMNNAAFLRAERRADGMRTFKIVAGEPLDTSFGADLYLQVFGPEPAHKSSEPV
jgi:MutS domain V